MIPERNNYWLLDSVAGWQIASGNSTGIAFTSDQGDITLDPLPGSAMSLDGSLARCITCPVAVAGDSKGRLFVADGADNRVTVVDLSTKTAKVIAAFGRRGDGLRHFKRPHSMTILPSGAIAIADGGNRRVQLFSASPYVLLQVWGAPEIHIKPIAVASDLCGTVYIADAASRTILRVKPGIEWLEPIGAGVLTDPVELAVGPDQSLAVVDGRGANAAIVMFPSDGSKPVRLTLIPSPLCLAFDGSGNLFAGTANAIVSKLQPDATQLSGWSLGGEGVSDVDGAITKLAWVKGHGLIAVLNRATPGTAPRLFSMNPGGAYRVSGSFVAGPLDSYIESCSWHRVRVMGTVPGNTSIAISSSTSADKQNWTPFVSCAVLGGSDPDCLVQSPPGRYLRLVFQLTSTGTVTPQIHAIQVYFPRQSYLQYLPAVFQDDDQARLFLDRFLSIFQTTFDDFDDLLDNLWRLFDPYMTPDQMFPWLAAWVALPIDPTMPLPKQRQLLKSAFQNYLIRGTVSGLQRVIQDYASVANIRILEHYRLRNYTFLPVSGGLGDGARLWSESFYARLQVGVSSTVGAFRLTNAPPPAAEPYDRGANQFSVLFPANPYATSVTATAIQTVLDREKPAYTQAFLCPIFPRLRVGVQATLGVDAYVGTTNSMILGKLATLSYDSVLARSQAEREQQALGLNWYRRLGENARIL